LIKLLRWSDLFFSKTTSVCEAWFRHCCCEKKTLVVAHQNLAARYPRRDDLEQPSQASASVSCVDHWRLATGRSADQLAAIRWSSAIPMDYQHFDWLPDFARDKTLAFVGRLVSEQGRRSLLRALQTFGKTIFVS